MSQDPIKTNPELYRVVFDNERVRVLEYRDRPSDRTALHQHPDSVMITLSAFTRRLTVAGQAVEVTKLVNEVGWLPAQTHMGENVGTTETHVLVVELK